MSLVRHHFAATLAIVAALFTAACQTTGSTAAKDSPYTLLHDQGDELRARMASGNWPGVAELLDDERAYFDAHPTLIAEARRTANDGWPQKLVTASQALAELNWPMPRSDWPTLKSRLGEIEATWQSYQASRSGALAHRVLWSTEAQSLHRDLDRLKDRIRADAAHHFAQSNGLSPFPFLRAYPVSMEPAKLVADAFDHLRPKLGDASVADLAALAAATDRDTLGEANWRTLGAVYLDAQEKLIGKNTPPVLRKILAAKAAKAQGFDIDPALLPEIGMVEATSQTLLREGQIDFAAAIDIDLPVQTTRYTLSEILDMPKAEGPRYVIVLNVALAKASRRVINLKEIPSTLFLGFSAGEASGGVAKIDPTTGHAVRQYDGVPGASAQYQYGKPQAVGRPVVIDYAYSQASIQARKTMTAHFYVIDRERDSIFKSAFDASEERRFNVLYNIDRRDPKKARLEQENETEKDVKEFETDPMAVKLSSVLEHYASAKKRTRIKNYAELRKALLKDKNTALASYEANRFDARPLNDPRFDSVVAVYQGQGSMGSGFYIRPDIVMTNWHVVDDADYVEMKTYSGRETYGRVLARDVRLDIALVKVQDRGNPVAFYTGRDLDLGKTVEAIGHPKRLLFSVTRGIVSAIRNHPSINLPEGAGKDVLYIQTDAPVNSGNSGGPLFLGNKVIGMNTFVVRKDIAEGLNFAVHYSELLAFLNEHLSGFSVDAAKRSE